MDEGHLADRIAASPALSSLRDDIAREVSFQSDGSFQFDPITIIMIISIIVQVIIHCREKRTDEQIAQDIRDVRSLPPRQLMRLRRRINRLWREHCHGDPSSTNPIMTALYAVSDNANDEAIQELIKLAKQQ